MNNAKVTLLGNLTKDPTMTKVGENNVCNFMIGVSTSQKDSEGNFKSNFYNIAVWGRQAEQMMNRLQKGSQVFVVGDLSADTYVSNADKKSYPDLKVVASDVRALARLKERPQQEETMDF